MLYYSCFLVVAYVDQFVRSTSDRPVIGGIRAYFIDMPQVDVVFSNMAALAHVPGISGIMGFYRNRQGNDETTHRGFIGPKNGV